MKRKFKYWIRRYITVPLVSMLVLLGTNRNTWLWRIVYFLSPYLAGFCVLMEDSRRPENTLLWYWQEGDPEKDPQSVDMTMADIDEMTKRAPVPFGGDDFLIMIRQYGALPSRDNRFNFDQNEDVERFLKNHPLIRAWNLPGNRWKDWKKGQAKERLQDILNSAEPNRLAPLTMICVVIIGRAVARSIFAMQGKTPSTRP